MILGGKTVNKVVFRWKFKRGESRISYRSDSRTRLTRLSRIKILRGNGPGPLDLV